MNQNSSRHSCTGFDYLSLVAGAPADALPPPTGTRLPEASPFSPLTTSPPAEGLATSRSGFLFSHPDPRHFGEVLYLKIDFLERILPDIRLTLASLAAMEPTDALHSTQMRLTPESGGPWLWCNTIIRSDRFLTDCSDLPLSPPDFLSAAGFLWLFALTAINKDHGSTAALQQAIATWFQAGDEQGALLAILFPPDRNLWDSAQATTIAGQWQHAWNEALTIGLEMVRPYLGSQHPVMIDHLFEAIASLKQELIALLFSASAPPAAAKNLSNASEDIAIASILDAIADRWRKESMHNSPAKPAQNTGTAEPTAFTDPSCPVFNKKLDTEDLAETVILSAATLREEISEQTTTPPPPQRPLANNLEETLIQEPSLTSNERLAEPKANANTTLAAPGSDLTETLVLSKEDRPEQEKTDRFERTSALVDTLQQTPARTDQRLTDLLNAASNNTDHTDNRKIPPRPRQHEDDIPETLILKPGKRKP